MKIVEENGYKIVTVRTLEGEQTFRVQSSIRDVVLESLFRDAEASPDVRPPERMPRRKGGKKC